VSDKGRSRPRGGSLNWQEMTKAERRAAAKAEAARAKAAARRRRLLTRIGWGLAIALVVVVGGYFLFFSGSGKPASTASSESSASSASPTPTRCAPAGPAPASTGKFPPLPAGADPALGTKPKPAAGTDTLSQLNVTTLITGTGAAAANCQQITVNYVGVSYSTGNEFDSSWKGSKPFTFQLGAGEVIRGWDQGLVGVKVGSRVQLDIPADLAYGDNPTGGQPGGPLRFVIDVLAVQ
jgi:peptidylprolyl isomerase